MWRDSNSVIPESPKFPPPKLGAGGIPGHYPTFKQANAGQVPMCTLEESIPVKNKEQLWRCEAHGCRYTALTRGAVARHFKHLHGRKAPAKKGNTAKKTLRAKKQAAAPRITQRGMQAGSQMYHNEAANDNGARGGNDPPQFGGALVQVADDAAPVMFRGDADYEESSDGGQY